VKVKSKYSRNTYEVLGEFTHPKGQGREYFILEGGLAPAFLDLKEDYEPVLEVEAGDILRTSGGQLFRVFTSKFNGELKLQQLTYDDGVPRSFSIEWIEDKYEDLTKIPLLGH